MSNRNFSLLSYVVKIKEQFARSARIDQDEIANSGFIYSTSIDVFLNTLATHQLETQQSAYTWTGPYGSGKSTLALSLMSILKGKAAARKTAAKSYKKSTADMIWKAFPPGPNGWDVISLVGRKTSLEYILSDALEHDVHKSKTDDVVQSVDQKEIQAEILKAIDARIKRQKANGGIILFIDEMGKLLEAATSGDADVYFYQLLAEAASRSNGRLIIIGILHQTFQEYASNSSKRIRDEWGKVHGRFVDISLNLTNSEQLELISNAISANNIPDSAQELALDTFQLLTKIKRSPSEAMLEQMQSCWPLNPICALALGPISRRSYGQNQRSIFSFLTSGEPLGLRDFINRTEINDSIFYTVADLWDYLDLNWGSAIAVSGDSHHFANVKDALSRLSSLDESRSEHLKILKTISILQLTEQLTGVSATHDALKICLNSTSHKVTRDVNFLKDNSLIIYKKYKKTYSLYEGSDFDIEAEIESATQFTNDINLSKAAKPFLPSDIVAKRHYFRTGALRWVDICLCSPSNIEQIIQEFKPNASNFGLLLIVDTKSKNEFLNIVKQYSNYNFIIFGRSETHQNLNEHLSEYTALENIMHSSSALLKDKVARREVRDRIESTKSVIENIVNLTIEKTEWQHIDKDWGGGYPSLLASKLADQLFCEAPIIKNELINRSKPSGSANAALKQLNYALIRNTTQKNLGFEKHPAERGIYESVIKDNNLHSRTENGAFSLSRPTELDRGQECAVLTPLWQDTLDFLKAERNRKVSLAEVHDRWAKPPFGVKSGLFPLLDTLFCSLESDRIAFYREEVFVASIQEIEIDFIHKTPALIQLRWLDMDSDTRLLLSKLSNVVAEISDQAVTGIEPLEVSRSLVLLYDGIEPWAKRTSRVSGNAKKIRAIFKRASDPAQFTLNDIPNIDGEINISDAQSLDNLIFKIKDGLVELRSVFNSTVSHFRDFILNELGVNVVSENRLLELNERAQKVRGISGKNDVESFVLQLTKITSNLDDYQRLGWVILGKPTRDWIDSDIDQLFVKATKLAREFKNLETMTAIKGREQTSYAFALITHSNINDSLPNTKSFELSQNELKDAEELANQLKKMYQGTTKKTPSKTILAALSILAHEENIR